MRARCTSVALLLVLLAPVLWHVPAVSAPACGKRKTGWSSDDAPSRARAFAVLPDGSIVATDGRAVHASAALGCPWGEVWRVPDVPSSEFPYVNEQIALLAALGERLFMVTTGPHFLVSSDGGRSWSSRDDGLRPGGVPSELAVASSEGRVVYLTVNVDVSDEALNNGLTPGSQGITATATHLYRSDDSGATWDLVATPSSIFGPRGSRVSAGTEPGAIWDLKVGPDDSDAVWVATNAGLFASADGGSTWTAAISNGAARGPDIRAVDVAQAGAVTAIEPTTGRVYRSADGARGPWTSSSFTGFKTVYGNQAFDPMVWLARGRQDGPLLASGPKGVFMDAGSSWTDVSPLSLGSGVVGTLVDLSPDPSSPTTFWGRQRAGSTIYRYSVPPPPTPDTDAGGGSGSPARLGSLSVPSPSIGALARPKPARLSPPRAQITLRPGASTERTYRLHLPPRPGPLDVFFLLDSTVSMSDVIRSLARSVGTIVTRLRAQGIDVWAGLGQFRTYPRPGEESFGGEPYHFAYRRELAVTPPGRKLVRALLDLEGNGQSGANLTALLQAVTGSGQDVLPPGPSGADVPKDLDAAFRPDALKVIVHAADTWFATPERGDPNGNYRAGTWPGPPFEDAIGALAGAGVRHVGIAVGESNRRTDGTDPRNVFDDLAAVSEGTETFAPRAGIDCDGDRITDVRADEPLVCGLAYERASTNLAGAVAGLLEAVRDVGPVRLVDTSDSPVVESIDPGTVSHVDLRAANRLKFRVTYRCPIARTRDRYDVELAALARDEVVARATATVDCRPPRAAVQAPIPRLDDLAQVGVVAIPPPPPPPLPVNAAPGTSPVNAPAPAAEPAPAPAQAPHSQTVPVAQRQVQPQLAFVRAVQQVREQVGMEHAMVRLSPTRSDPLEAVKFGLACSALSMLLLWGMGTAVARSRVRVAPARSR